MKNKTRKMGVGLCALALSVSAFTASPAFANVAEGTAVPFAAIEKGSFGEIITDLTSEGRNYVENKDSDYYGALDNIQGIVVVKGKLNIPSEAVAGDTLTLTLGEYQSYRAFEGLELRTNGGELLATVSATASKMTFTFAEGVETLQETSASFEVTLRPQADKGAGNVRKVTINLVAPDGTVLGPKDTYSVRPDAPNVTGLQLSPNNVGNELGIQTKPVYSPQVEGNLDPKSVKLTVTPLTKGAVPVCNAADGAKFNLQWIGVDGNVKESDAAAVVGSCEGQNLVMKLAPGVTVPEGMVGVRAIGSYVVDRPGTEYTFGYKIEANGTVAEGERSVVSGQLEGVGDGQLRPAKISTEKTVVSSTDRLMVGDEVTYEIKTSNVEEFRTAYAVKTSDKLPEGLEFVSASGSGKLVNGVVSWPAKDLAAGKSRTYTVVTKVTDAAAAEITNVATNKGENTCFKGDDTGSICSSKASLAVALPGLETTKTVAEIRDENGNGVEGDPGDVIVYTINAKNIGNIAESSILVTDELLGIEDQECLAEGTVLEPGASADCVGPFEYTVTEEDLKASEVVNVATLSVPGIDPVPGTVTTEVKEAPKPVKPAEPVQAEEPALAFTGGAQSPLLIGSGITLLLSGIGAVAASLLRKKKGLAEITE
ncbi:DUF7507 domain-containing protein [Leucobacter chinensis]|uniref:DUF7507 domain-containing protein n=1 Tax=Leucobacter chinensis TaxID=2851010 RepID=UPI001C21CBA5|nr:Ig-like domain-containing protein [Leucobacter chinensis]